MEFSITSYLSLSLSLIFSADAVSDFVKRKVCTVIVAKLNAFSFNLHYNNGRAKVVFMQQDA
jgi:hypothetical protein